MEPHSHNIFAKSWQVCPFHDGPATLDILLAELAPEESEAMDAALELRFAMQAKNRAEDCVRAACRLRKVLDGRHHLAFYRVRRWLNRAIMAEARIHRSHKVLRHVFPLNCARLDELANTLRAKLSETDDRDDRLPLLMHFSFNDASADEGVNTST